MVSFRKVFLLMAILVAIATIASAQPATCIAYTSNAPNVRWEGLAEEVGQVVLECSGGVSAARGTALNTVNVQIFLNTNVTSRRTIANDNPATEAVLLIDEPTPAQVTTATMCAVGASCPGIAVGGGIYYDPTGAIVEQERVSGPPDREQFDCVDWCSVRRPRHKRQALPAYCQHPCACQQHRTEHPAAERGRNVHHCFRYGCS